MIGNHSRMPAINASTSVNCPNSGKPTKVRIVRPMTVARKIEPPSSSCPRTHRPPIRPSRARTFSESARHSGGMAPATLREKPSRSFSTKNSHTGTTTRPRMKVATRTTAFTVGATIARSRSANACPLAAI